MIPCTILVRTSRGPKLEEAAALWAGVSPYLDHSIEKEA